MGKKIICLFDVDGTMTAPRLRITEEMEQFMAEQVRPKATVGLVGGSDLVKISEQMGGEDVLGKYDYVFAENGLVAYKNGELVGKQSILKFKGEASLQKLINFSLRYCALLLFPILAS